MKDLKNAFGSPDPEFQERVRQTLFRIEEKEEIVVKKKMTFSMALALILCVCIVTVSAFAGSTLLTEKPDVTQSPLSQPENNNPNGTPGSTDAPILSTPTPQPTSSPVWAAVTPMPTFTPMPFSTPMPTISAEPIYVWSAAGDTSYHFNQFCAEAKKGLARVSLAVAENRQQTQCSACSALTYSYYELISEVYLPENSKVFHKSTDCSEMSLPCTVPLLISALEAGAQPCPLCYDAADAEANSLLTPMPTSTPIPIPTEMPGAVPDPDSSEVYLSIDSNIFHSTRDCADLSAAYYVSYLEIAITAGDTPCPLCFHTDDANAPTPLLTPQPTPPAESGYYYTPEDWFCHADPACINEGDSFIGRAFEEDLIAMGKRACETCMEPFSYYYTPANAYYHAVPDCAHAGALMTEQLPEDQLLALGLRDCPWCLGWYNRYYSFDDRYYHASSDCISFIGAETDKKHAEEKTLLEIGWLPCETCFGTMAFGSASGLQVFSTPNGSFYHTLSDCSGMKNAEIVSLADALSRNQTPCPLCHTCYIEEGSDLYHMSVSCSRLSAPQTRLLNALPAEYQPCGLCVYFLELNGNLYHRFPRCSQFGADGKAHAYTPCSLDLLILRGSIPCELCASGSASAPTSTPDPVPTNAPDFAERDLLISGTYSDTTVFM